ncbi:MAG: BON domain-containing protein [Pirellulales bacterium]|nr:BON domain-containing protein [Pirellulales bacterium]
MRRFILAAALAAAALAPLRASADEQAIAQQIAGRLKTSGKLQNYKVGVQYNEGTATLEGRVSSVQQMAAALAVAKQQPGVKQVINKLSIAPGDGGVRQTSAQTAVPQRMARTPQRGQVPRPIQRVAQLSPDCEQGGGMVGDGGSEYVGTGAPMPIGAYGGAGAAMAGAARYDQPNMPNYAWPSYAAHPNYAAVTYPKQYSPTAWPFIGPFYPYPQVPLGWRKVTLEWDDGWWFLDFKDNCEH